MSQAVTGATLTEFFCKVLHFQLCSAAIWVWQHAKLPGAALVVIYKYIFTQLNFITPQASTSALEGVRIALLSRGAHVWLATQGLVGPGGVRGAGNDQSADLRLAQQAAI